MTEQGHEAGQERAEERHIGRVPEQPTERESVPPHENVPPSDSGTNVGTDLARMVAELGATVRAHLDGLGRR